MRKFDYRRTLDTREEGVIIEDMEDQLLEIIQRGENVNVEFKKELSEELLETIIAFANTKGGRIFLGVDDNCRIVGFRKDESRIQDMIANGCDPRIEVNIMEVNLQGRIVTILEVPEGSNKPYIHKSKGIFIRSGASDRQATRSELDEIYAKKQIAPLYH
jgi:ATP-dependent DNA helicase RecG